MWIYERKIVTVSHHPTKFGGHRHCGNWRYNAISLSLDLLRPLDQSVIWLYGLDLLKISQHPTKFNGHRHCGIEDIMVLFCHVILQDHVIKWSSEFIVVCFGALWDTFLSLKNKKNINTYFFSFLIITTTRINCFKNLSCFLGHFHKKIFLANIKKKFHTKKLTPIFSNF